jgi:hypothetical protein
MDQAMAGLGDFAKLVRAYYDALLATGFTPAEALSLTAVYQQTVTAAASQMKQGESE